MSKPERGLPKDFDIKVPERPVQLGDYLDEPAARPARPPQPPVEPVRVVPDATWARPLPLPDPAPAPRTVAPQRSAPPRKQFNMTPETMRMLDDLLAHIRLYSGERDVRASELIHALVLAVHEVRPFLDLTQVPQRGKWGSATAAVLPVALKDAFQQAMAKSRGR